MADDYVVKFVNVHKTYLLGIEGVPALRGVTCNVRRGEFVMIVGKSGSGKTTMLNIMGTIDKPTRGEVSLCGSRITHATPDHELAWVRMRQLGFVFQTFNLLPSMTALENVEMPMILAAVPAARRRARATALLNSVGMGARIGHTPAQLSGGEQQRVTIARALSNEPDILLLDEPTGDLDTVNSDIVMRFLIDLNETSNVTLVMVTHEMSMRAYAHRVIHMLDGKIARHTITPDAVRAESIEALRQRTVLASVPGAGHATSSAAGAGAGDASAAAAAAGAGASGAPTAFADEPVDDLPPERRTRFPVYAVAAATGAH